MNKSLIIITMLFIFYSCQKKIQISKKDIEETKHFLEEKCSGYSTSSLKDILAITDFEVRNCPSFTENDFRFVNNLPNLEYLNIHFTTNITGIGLKQLRYHPKLKSIAFAFNKNFNFSNLIHLSNLKNINSLFITKVQLNSKDLYYISQIKNLELLFLTYTGLSGEGLEHLNRLKKLEMINLSDNPLKDEFFIQLAFSKTLESIRVTDTPLSEESIAKLYDIKTLSHINSGLRTPKMGKLIKQKSNERKKKNLPRILFNN